MIAMSLNVDRYDERDKTHSQGAKRASGKPAPLLAKREAKGERGQPNRQQQCTNWIEVFLPPPQRRLFPVEVQRNQQDEQADRHIDIKDPTPGQILRNDPPKRR